MIKTKPPACSLSQLRCSPPQINRACSSPKPHSGVIRPWVLLNGAPATTHRRAGGRRTSSLRICHHHTKPHLHERSSTFSIHTGKGGSAESKKHYCIVERFCFGCLMLFFALISDAGTTISAHLHQPGPCDDEVYVPALPHKRAGKRLDGAKRVATCTGSRVKFDCPSVTVARVESSAAG